jgi:hypothetical protein
MILNLENYMAKSFISFLLIGLCHEESDQTLHKNGKLELRNMKQYLFKIRKRWNVSQVTTEMF